MNKISNNSQINGQPSYAGTGTTVGQPPSLASPNVVPSTGSAAGAGVSGVGANNASAGILT